MDDVDFIIDVATIVGRTPNDSKVSPCQQEHGESLVDKMKKEQSRTVLAAQNSECQKLGLAGVTNRSDNMGLIVELPEEVKQE